MKHISVVCKDTTIIDMRWYWLPKLIYLAFRYCGGIVRFERSQFND